ncbi:MAG: hypothetical protein L7F77_05350 [Candidatus Magnetominusculus sp. LBB02]|nr:hypothetical protein [Candidatus Magnetominusculus sp. LBB02]
MRRVVMIIMAAVFLLSAGTAAYAGGRQYDKKESLVKKGSFSRDRASTVRPGSFKPKPPGFTARVKRR